MAVAYGTLANGGVKVKPVAITKIIDRNGQIVEEASMDEKRVVSEKDAYIITNMLESVITGGTGGGAAIGRPAAGKTGTTDESKDAWFVGYTPDLVAAVWMGDDFGVETLNGTTGGTIPAHIWSDFMRVALADTPASDFTAPPGAAAIANQGYEAPKPKEDPKAKDEDKDKSKDKDGVKKDDGATVEDGDDGGSKDSGETKSSNGKSSGKKSKSE